MALRRVLGAAALLWYGVTMANPVAGSAAARQDDAANAAPRPRLHGRFLHISGTIFLSLDTHRCSLLLIKID